MPRPAKDTAAYSTPFDLTTLWWLLREKARLIGVITASALLAGLLYLSRCERVYAATTTIEVQVEQERLLKPESVRQDERSVGIAIKTIEQNLKSPPLLLRLAHHPKLAQDPGLLADKGSSASDAKIQESIARRISVEARRNTNLLDITAEANSPVAAQQLSALLVDEFVRSNSEERVQVSREAQATLREEADRLKTALRESETNLQKYKQQHHAVSLEEKENIVVERLKELNQRVTQARADRLKIEADRAQLTQLAGQPPDRLLMLTTIANAPEVTELQRQLTVKNAELATTRQRYKPEHPKYIAAESAHGEVLANRDAAILRAADLVDTALQAAVATEKSFEEALRAQESIALELSEIAIPYQTLAREVESNRALYGSLLARLKESDIAQGIPHYAVRLVSPAAVPERPIRPNKRVILLLSLCGGLTMGLTAAVGTHALDRSLRTVDQAEQGLKLRSLAAIPQEAGIDLSSARHLFVNKPNSAFAEAIRGLRTALLFKDRDDPLRSVLFASAIPGEGKSLSASTYATALAHQGLRTLLIDADLRLPSIGPAFLEAGAKLPGLVEFLRGSCRFEQAIHFTDIENLSILPAGRRVSDPAELLGKADLAHLMETGLGQFDRIVIDSAPVHAVSDALLLVPYVDAVCLVVRAALTPEAAVVRALEKLRESGAHVPGFILNGLPLRGRYHYHYHAPGYGGDEVYGASAAEK